MNKNIFLVITVLLIVSLIFVSFLLKKDKILNLEQVMEIIEKSSDYKDSLKAIGIEAFDPVVIESYAFTPKDHQEKYEEFKDMEEQISQIILNNNSYLFILKSKSDETKGLLAIIDTKKKEAQLLVALLEIKGKI